ncbi:MAG: ABC transporter substrate-binding protein [Bradymonadales bacterium]|nr:ABC transporter substrate-binding protein [Bradymonadales bacterium]
MRMRTGVAAAGCAVLALGPAACGGGGDDTSSSTSKYNAAVKGIVNPSDQRGGTLRLANASDIDSLDPARSYYAWAWNFQRAYYVRTLVTQQAAPGDQGLVLVPDLATSLPEISADGLTYTFTLKAGLKYEDGTPIRARDIKYGIERIFAQDVLSGGPTYLIDLLDQGQDYPGPYEDDDPDKLGLKSVETPDDTTIVFHLRSPFADFPYLLAMGGASPVPQDKDTGDRYSEHPISTGPYRFETIEPGKKLVLVRNPNWDAATDSVRKALPDTVELALGLDPNEIDNQLIDGTLDVDTAQTGVQSAAQAKILLDSSLKAQADGFNTGFIRYVAISTGVAPFDNVHCRRAVHYALDKTAMQTARGGAEAGGDIGVNMLPPNIAGHDPSLDPYNTKSGRTQVDQAKEELARCGRPNGFETVIAVRNKGKEPKTAEALQQSLAAVGITASIDQSDASLYFRSTIGSPDNVHRKGYGLMLAGWGSDFPTGYGFLQTLIDGRAILPSGNNNYSELNDPEINALIDQARAASDRTRAAEIWKQINARVMDTAVLLPFVYDKALNYRNPRLTNVFVNPSFGMWDFSALGVGGK